MDSINSVLSELKCLPGSVLVQQQVMITEEQGAIIGRLDRLEQIVVQQGEQIVDLHKVLEGYKYLHKDISCAEPSSMRVDNFFVTFFLNSRMSVSEIMDCVYAQMGGSVCIRAVRLQPTQQRPPTWEYHLLVKFVHSVDMLSVQEIAVALQNMLDKKLVGVAGCYEEGQCKLFMTAFSDSADYCVNHTAISAMAYGNENSKGYGRCASGVPIDLQPSFREDSAEELLIAVHNADRFHQALQREFMRAIVSHFSNYMEDGDFMENVEFGV